MGKTVYLPDPNAPLWKVEVSPLQPYKVHVFHNGHRVGGLQHFRLDVDDAGGLSVELKYAAPTKTTKKKRKVKRG